MIDEFKYNMNEAERNEIFEKNCDFPHGKDTIGGIVYYSELNVDTLKTLLDKKFADPEMAQNDCPSIGKIYKFMQKHPEFKAHGYYVTKERSDYRVSIEGVETDHMDINSIESFVKLFKNADEFKIENKEAYCWFS